MKNIKEKFREEIARKLFRCWGAGDTNWDELPKYRKNTYREWIKEDVLSFTTNHEGHQYALKIVQLDAELPTQRWDELIEHEWVALTPTEIQVMKSLVRAGFKKVVED